MVELSGRVETFSEKLEAEHIALALRGVKGVAEEIFVRLPSEKGRQATKNSRRAARVLSWDSRLQGDTVKAKVENGWIILTGEVGSSREIEVACRQEAVIVGLTAPRRSRPYFGALVLAVRDGDGWRYVGHVGTGFSHTALEELYGKLWPLRTDASP